MKKCFFFLLLVGLSLVGFAQSNPKEVKNDIILKLSGEELIGKITEIGDSTVKFVYPGETTVYNLKKKDIQKIIHASGRVETYKHPSANSIAQPSSVSQNKAENPVANSADHHNKIAILPFGFLRDNMDAGQTMSIKAQSDAYTYLAAHSKGYKLLDPRTTNVLLQKAGVTKDNLSGFTMTELCNMLGVEYIIEGTVTVNKGMQTSTGSTSYKTSTDGKSYYNNDKKGYAFSSSSSAQMYQTSIAMNIYNDKNDNIYSQEHRATFASTDGSYSGPLTYLLKRCPLYRK
jgi:TolB-like protein